VSVASDGTLYLGPATANAPVKFEGDFVINGRSLTTELASLDSTLASADQENFFRLNALRWQKFTITSPRGVAAFQINGVGYLAIADASQTTQTVYIWDTPSQSFVFLQNIVSAGNNNEFEFVHVTTPTDQYFLIDGPTGATSKLYKFQTATGKFDTGTNIGVVGATTRQWTFASAGTNFYLGQATATTCALYQWNGASFSNFYSSAATGCNTWCIIPRPDKPANNWNMILGTSTGTSNFYWDGNSLNTSLQPVTTEGTTDVETFVFGTEIYIVSAENRNITNTFYGEVFQLNKATNVFFAASSNWVTQDDKDVELFSYNGDLYLFAAHQNTATNRLQPQMRIWNKILKRFDLVASISYLNNYFWKSFTPDGVNYYVFLSTNGSSYLYKLTNNL